MNPADQQISYVRYMMVIVLVGALLRLWGVASQPLIADEVGVAFSAVNYMENGQFGPTMWYHPNLRNIVVYLLGETFGYNPVSLRCTSLALGILTIPLTGAILRRMGGGVREALLASLLMALEEVHIVFSRQAIQETWTTCFFLAGVYLVLVYLQDGRRPWQLLTAGVLFGAGLASKSHAAFPLLVCLCSCAWLSFREKFWSRLAFEAVALTMVPVAIYLLTWLPWFARGYDLLDWIGMQQALLHKMTLHTGNPMDQPIDREAWQWFLRPMVYGNFTLSGQTPHITLSWSNPLVWLGVIPATLHQAWLGWKGGGGAAGLTGRLAPVVLFLVSYLPLALSSRPIWLLSSLAVLPFAFMVLARALVEGADSFSRGRRLLAGYVALAALVSLLAWPMATGKGMHYGYLTPFVERYRSVMEGGLERQP